jgi:CelD/BcsL family acetyltransferase involved in cellulose biosynthesis
MLLEEISDVADFLTLERPWNDCLAAMRGGNPFLSHQWLYAWWSVFGQDAKLMVLVVRDGEDILAAAPLFRTHRPFYGVPVDQILFIGTQTFDRLSFLYRDPNQDHTRALWRYLQSVGAGHALVRLEALPQDDPTLEASRGFSGIWAEEESSCLPYIPIDRTWEQYRKGLTHKFRSEMRTRPKVFARWGNWRLDVCRGCEVRPHLDELSVLERSSTKLQMGAAFLADVRNHELLNRLLAVVDQVEPVLLRLLIDDRLIAYVLGFIHRGVYCAYNTAYHPDYEKGSPGKWIMDQAIEFSFAERLVEFDFLRGQFDYKERWHPQVRHSRRRLLFASNPLGWALRTGVFGLRPQLKRILGRDGGR